MKVVLFAFVVFASCHAAPLVEEPVPEYLLHGTCGTPQNPNPAPLGKVIRQTKEFFEDVFEGHCQIEGKSFIDYFMAKETECLDLFLQSYCYTQLVSARTDSIWGLTFDQLKKEIPDIGGVTKTWCSNKCSEKLLPYVWKCYTDPKIKPFVVEKISAQFDWAKGEVAKYEEILAGSPIGRIITVGLENWQKWSDVGEAIKVNRPAILKMFGDLRYNFADFCDSKCYEPSFDYAEKLIASMNRGGCDRPRYFCGECQENARQFTMDPKNNVPCCFRRIFDWVLSRTDAGVAASQGIGNAYLLSDVAVLSSKNEDFQCWRSVLEPAIFTPGIIWTCSLGFSV